MPPSRSWIFLRGLARSSEHWGPFKDAFKQQFPGDEVEFLDLAGNGTERHRFSYLAIQQAVNDLRARSLFVREKRKVYLLTISLGGMLGVDWASRFPEDLEHLILINTSDRRHAHFYERLMPRAYLPLLKVPFSLGGQSKESRILEITASGFGERSEWAQKFADMKRVSIVNTVFQMISASRYAFPENKPKCPITVFSGLQDQLVDPVCSERLAMAWKVPHIKCIGGGHDIPLTHPQWLAAELAKAMA